MRIGLILKEDVSVVDPAILVFNKHLTVPTEDVFSFKDSVEGHFEAFTLAGPVLQPAFTAISNWTRQMNRDHKPVFDAPCSLRSTEAILFCVDTPENVIHQVSISHMRRIL